ncbi:TUDOR/PWWP/MBT SUPERFAMILY PROTEIN [Salix koriyanagi]|uniref:TUDOR/PWWP/MBT SUPERFAMILY PROTEIN n=1 Tax=Salix koriyanagi TaxID=2511006 RepID=A0A9Q0ZLG5_9ROSI|nr:TUDOR/PWWP/MBT SUPERFAMILY PROTEIN [Salix koriyanagi]
MEAITLGADKTTDPGAKTIKDNGKEGFVDDLSPSFDVNNLEDSEINGVSSLLKMQEGGSLKGLETVLDYLSKNEKREFGNDGLKTDLLDANEGNIDDAGEDGREGEMDMAYDQFRVGEFVWGKIRSHPWWPGRIYDPLNASDYAKQCKQRDKILVAYFGDSTFAWCNPSQLSPFEESFVEMFKQSTSKSFVNAVKEAVDEVGRLVDLKMTCSCVPQENLMGFGRSLAVNTGIKEGLLVPEGGIEKFSTALFEPASFLPVLKDVAQFVNTVNMLEVTVLKNWLSAFYRTKGGYQLPTYHEPLPISGLEDDTRNWTMNLTDHSGGVQARIQGPVVEDWHSSPTGFKFDQTTQGLLHKCQDMDDRWNRRTKQKSIAEILRADTDAETENKEDVTKEETESRKQISSADRETGKDGDKTMGQVMDTKIQNVVGEVAKDKASSGKPESLSGREKRKASDKADAEEKSKVGDVGEAGTNSGKYESTFGRKKRKVSDKAAADCKSDVGNVAEIGTNSEKPASSTGRKKRKVTDEVNADGGNDSVSRLTRKESTLSESFVASDLEVGGRDVKKASSAVENDDAEENIDETRDKSVSGEKKIDGGLSDLRGGDEATARVEKDSFSRERRQSKYLSPPYTNILSGQRKKGFEAESKNISNDPRSREQMTKVADHLICEKFQMKAYEETGGDQISGISGPQTPKQDQNTIIDLVKIKAPVNQMLSHVQFLALNPTYLEEGNSVGIVTEFVSVFRSSIYRNGSNYKMYNKHQPGRTKRKSQESEPGTSGVEQNLAGQSSADYKSRSKKPKRSEESKLEKLKVRQAATATDVKTSDKESDGKSRAAAALYVTFSPGSSLPSKNDLIMIYEKYGGLNQEETEVIYNGCARIVFMSSSEAEEAFNDSQIASPFGAASVTFRLQYHSSAETKTPEIREIPSLNSSTLAKDETNMGKEFASQSSANDVSQLNYIKQKLEMMSSILEMSDGTDMKSKLEGEIKGLLEKVSTMARSSL